ncbi:cytochrome P450 2J4-like [Clavelina lepadiformis]|uniref:cytochrome P450 2J4-like n=1 Tax=Clavelina lepadiformis TaxID=159417 RepID=UPI00404160FB
MSFFSQSRPGFPPGRKGLPLVGVIPWVGGGPAQKIFEWSKEYGPIMSVRMGSQDWVVLNDYDSMHQGFVEQPTKFSGRPLIPLLNQYNKSLGLGSVDYGDSFKAYRSFGEKILRGSGIGAKTIEDRVMKETELLVEVIRAQEGKAFVLLFFLDKAVANCIWSLQFGARSNYEDPSFNRMFSALIKKDESNFAGTATGLMGLLPCLMSFPFFSSVNEEFLEYYKHLLGVFTDIIAEHKKTFDKSNIRGFVDAYFVEQEKGTKHFTEEELIQYSLELFKAGTQTAAGMLGWGLLCMIHYPETQTKLREEINQVIGRSAPVSMSCKSSLPYTNAFIQELMRYRTMVPFTVPHKTSEDAELGGFNIPKGVTVMGNIWAVHNDPDVWDEPNKFKPERFINENRDFVQSNRVIPFGLGPRDCLGYQVAQSAIFIMLVAMVRRFEFYPDPEATELPPNDAGAKGNFYIPSPFNLVAKEI